MSHLRRLSVFVDEPEPGRFHWVLHESTEDATVWTDVYASEGHYDIWLDALEAGNTALMKLVPDERVGPRAAGESEDEAPVG